MTQNIDRAVIGTITQSLVAEGVAEGEAALRAQEVLTEGTVVVEAKVDEVLDALAAGPASLRLVEAYRQAFAELTAWAKTNA